MVVIVRFFIAAFKQLLGLVVLAMLGILTIYWASDNFKQVEGGFPYVQAKAQQLKHFIDTKVLPRFASDADGHRHIGAERDSD